MRGVNPTLTLIFTLPSAQLTAERLALGLILPLSLISDPNPNAGWRRACELSCGGAEQDVQPEDTQHGVEIRDRVRVRVRVGGLQPEDTQHGVETATCCSGSDLTLIPTRAADPDPNPNPSQVEAAKCASVRSKYIPLDAS